MNSLDTSIVVAGELPTNIYTSILVAGEPPANIYTSILVAGEAPGNIDTSMFLAGDLPGNIDVLWRQNRIRPTGRNPLSVELTGVVARFHSLPDTAVPKLWVGQQLKETIAPCRCQFVTHGAGFIYPVIRASSCS